MVKGLRFRSWQDLFQRRTARGSEEDSVRNEMSGHVTLIDNTYTGLFAVENQFVNSFISHR